MQRRTALFLLAAAVQALGAAPAAQAADYPAKPIHIVVPYPPGGSADLIGRMVGERLAQSLGQPVVVDNKAGASGSIGSDAVARAAPDGYTLLVAISDTHAINPAVMPRLPYDPQKDFAPVALMATQPMLLAVGRNMPARTLGELVELARQKPGSLTYASNGKGGLQHLAMELFSRAAKTKLLHVPYKGAGPALSDVIGGQVDALFISLQGAGSNVAAGNLRPLAVAAERRLAALPGVPTLAEAGYPGLAITQWYGLMAPAGTPADIVARLNREVNAVLASHEVAEKLKAAGTEPAGGSPEQFRGFLAGEARRWAEVAASVGARLE
jgi:tripartite-type tricarboxylate transporter receptor subunit TctC